jgi:hypothetical protein
MNPRELIRNKLIHKHFEQMKEDFADEKGYFCKEFVDFFLDGDIELAIKGIKNLYEKDN